MSAPTVILLFLLGFGVGILFVILFFEWFVYGAVKLGYLSYEDGKFVLRNHRK